MESINRLTLEHEDLKEFLRGYVLDMPNCKVGDFGCEYGYTSLSLMIELKATECIGIDTFTGKDFSPTLEKAQQELDKLKSNLLSVPKELQDNSLIGVAQNLISKGHFPVLKQGDIVQDNALPNNFDFSFCKLVLGNIFTGEYNNTVKGKEGVNRAIQNIANSTKQNGIICLVEKDTINFTPFLQNAGLLAFRICHISRGDIGMSGRLTSPVSIVNYVVYLCKKS